MNFKGWLVDCNCKILDDKKPQTEYKIQYIREYVRLWLLISENRGDLKNINFIDCMCNAGIYSDGDLSTAMEVLELFIINAPNYPDINFNLFLNDYDDKRINNIKTIVRKIYNGQTYSNIFIYYSNDDVNNYICNFTMFDSYLMWPASTLIFVDPYNFRVVRIDLLQQFIRRYYCELSYNVFTSDYVRNKNDEIIYNCLGCNKQFKTTEEIIEYVTKQLKIGKMKYAFSYAFKNSKNAELYQILFITPNLLGLEKLKEALRKVFEGIDEYRNPRQGDTQLDLFTADDKETIVIRNCAIDTRKQILVKFKGRTVSYSEIEEYVIEKTILQKSNIIEYILKPLISENKITKCNKTERKSNYTKDDYIFI
jgi:three-Cys-motif partner protein